MSALNKALSFLRNKASAAKVGDRLPSVRQLAEECGVSLYSMSKALNVVCGEGMLSARPRRGITVTSTTATEPAEPGDRLLSRWEQIALVLSRRIRNSRGGTDTNLVLPKAVQAEFNTSPVTARKALLALVDRGDLMPHGRGYLAHSDRGYGALSVFIVNREFAKHANVRLGSNVRSLFNHLEMRCSRDGASLEYGFLQTGTDTVSVGNAEAQLRELARKRPRTMAVLSTAGISGDTAVPICEALLATGVPLALVDFSGAVEPARFYSHRVARVNVGTTTRDGALMAGFIAHKGYSRICYVSPPAKVPWSAERLQGLRRRLHELSEGASVVDITPAIPKGTPVHVRGRDMPQPTGVPTRLLRVHGQKNQNEEWVRHQTLLRDGLTEVLSQTMADNPPDLFVGANDSLAVACLDVLEGMGVAVPKQCAVVGFDNSTLATVAHLSSYDANWQAIASEILRFGYTCPDTLRKPVELAVDGFVVERLSTGIPH